MSLPQYGCGHDYWATTPEAAAGLGVVTVERVRQLVAAGRVPAVRHGRRWLFRRDQLEVVASAARLVSTAARG